MARLTSILLVVLCNYSGFARVEPSFQDSLSRFKQVNYPIPTAKAFSNKAIKALKKRDSLKFKKANARALHLAQAWKDSLGIADAYWNYAAYHIKYQQYDSSYYYYNKSRKMYAALNHTYYEAKMLYNLAYTKSKIKDYAGAELLAINAVKKFKQLSKHKSLYKSFNLLGVIFEEIEQYDKAINYLHKAAKYLNKSNSKKKNRYQAGIYNNLGIIYQKKNQQQDAIAYFKKALTIKDIDKTDAKLYARLKDNLAFSKFLEGNNLLVEKELLSALDLRKKIKHLPGQIISHLHLGHYYIANKDTLTAITHAKQALNLAKNIQLNRDILNAYQLLGKLQPSKTQEYFELYINLQQKIKFQERKVKNNFARIQYETGTYIAKNKQLTVQNILLWAGVLVMLLFLLFIYFLGKQRQKHKKLFYENQQNKANEKIYQLEIQQRTEWEKGRKIERQRIAEDLHDSVLSKLFGLRLGWSYLKLEANAPILKQHHDNIRLLQHIEEDLRKIARNLQQKEVEEENFENLLYKLIKQFKKLYALPIAFQSSKIPWHNLSPYVKVNIYLIIQEALQNALKHSQGSKVAISISLKNNQLRLSIADNGKGLQKTVSYKGMGFKNLESRTQKLLGTFSIYSSNKGTHLEFIFNFNKISAL